MYNLQASQWRMLQYLIQKDCIYFPLHNLKQPPPVLTVHRVKPLARLEIHDRCRGKNHTPVISVVGFLCISKFEQDICPDGRGKITSRLTGVMTSLSARKCIARSTREDNESTNYREGEDGHPRVLGVHLHGIRERKTSATLCPVSYSICLCCV